MATTNSETRRIPKPLLPLVDDIVARYRTNLQQQQLQVVAGAVTKVQKDIQPELQKLGLAEGAIAS